MAQQAQRSPFFADPDAGLPVGVQLNWRLRSLITSGRLAIGEQLPSVRQLADWSGVNINTARAVYEALERDGLVVTQQGRGTFVSPSALADEAVERIAVNALDEAAEAGIDPRDLIAATWACAALSEGDVSEAIDAAEVAGQARPTSAELKAIYAADERPSRQELHRQIGRLEAELAYLWQELPPEERKLAAPHSDPHISSAEELERVRDELMNQLRAARAAATKRFERESRSRGHLEAMTADPSAHRWESVSDEDMGEPGCRTYQVGPRYGPLGLLMNWWRVKVSGGCPLAAPLAAARGKTDGKNRSR